MTDCTIAYQLIADERITHTYTHCWKPFQKLRLRMLVNRNTIQTHGKGRQALQHHMFVHMTVKV